jgi:arsenate reductase
MEGVRPVARFVRAVLLALGCLAPSLLWSQTPAAAPIEVVFVCEHGSSKSLVAASHFNRLAKARGLAMRAVARGLTPDAGPPELVRQGLMEDGISLGPFTPTPLKREDFRPEARVIALGCALSAIAPEGASCEAWLDLPAVSDGYVPAREAIVNRVKRWIDTVAPAR